MYTTTTRERVCELRMEGKSLNQIHAETGISKSILSEWGIGKITSPHIRERLARRSDEGRKKGVRAQKEKRRMRLRIIEDVAKQKVASVDVTRNTAALLCAMLYWGEGGKRGHEAHFTNSDPLLIKTYLSLFRKAFAPKEEKFRVSLHMHRNDSEQELRKFWSEVTGIPLIQFQKTWIKPTFTENYRGGYKGCIAVRYYDTLVVQQIIMLYKIFAEMRA